ncbi:hypothetical protein, partial [Streptomyces sp. NPDC007088]|uniref:hypothetical protein n=1 Tax=Streptomyces sp. NPDC007088 TaxID=3364773 RepID=UPI0036BD4D2A
MKHAREPHPIAPTVRGVLLGHRGEPAACAPAALAAEPVVPARHLRRVPPLDPRHPARVLGAGPPLTPAALRANGTAFRDVEPL